MICILGTILGLLVLLQLVLTLFSDNPCWWVKYFIKEDGKKPVETCPKCGGDIYYIERFDVNVCKGCGRNFTLPW